VQVTIELENMEEDNYNLISYEVQVTIDLENVRGQLKPEMF
jgi:hypothetical protein